MSRISATGGRIGKYQGREVYKVTLSEYVNNRYYKDKYYVFLIDGELIYNNEAFASYDGNYVSVYDPHKKYTYYEVPKFDRAMPTPDVVDEGYETETAENETKTSSTSGYSTENEPMVVVDADATLAGVFNNSVIEGVYETDYFSGMTDALADAFLKANSECL